MTTKDILRSIMVQARDARYTEYHSHRFAIKTTPLSTHINLIIHTQNTAQQHTQQGLKMTPIV